MNPIAWFQGLDGTTLVVAICILMFIEETGVPLPFAPGDLVLAIGGIAVAGGRVNPILALIQLAEHQLLLALLILLPLVGLFLLTRAPARRILASMEAAGWTGPLRFSLDSVGVVLILGCLGLNFAGHAIVVAFGLPLFLDSIGTVLAGVVAGPWVGGSVGFISNLVSSNTVDPRSEEHTSELQ